MRLHATNFLFPRGLPNIHKHTFPALTVETMHSLCPASGFKACTVASDKRADLISWREIFTLESWKGGNMDDDHAMMSAIQFGKEPE